MRFSAFIASCVTLVAASGSADIACAQTARNGGGRYAVPPATGADSNRQPAQPATAVESVGRRDNFGVRANDNAVPTIGRNRAGVALRAPFELTQAETAYRDQFLKRWEAESDKIITFKCPFDRWEYKLAFAPVGRDAPTSKSRGQLAYAKPDKGSFLIEDIFRLKVNTAPDGKVTDTWPKSPNEIGERWVCDGKRVFNFNQKEKQLEVHPIPKEMQGKSIADGPLPFLFGAKADDLNQRYWIRIDRRTNETEVWIDARPKLLADAQSYKQVELILHRDSLLPKAMQVYEPNGDRMVYLFGRPTVNSQLDRFFGVFKAPRTPIGWKRVVLESGQIESQPPAQRGAQPAAVGALRPTPRTRY